ncbi:MAG: hypothetical protein R3A50_04560 [Saprospiraceae bacterium]
MKTISTKSCVFASLALLILLGANSAEIPRLSGYLLPQKSKEVKKPGFATAHSNMHIPTPDESNLECKNGREHSVPVPEPLYLQDYERVLYDFILRRKYVDLNWCVDKKVRDTGPWIEKTYYGVHPAVRIYYSPSMMYWLTGDPGYWQEGMKSGKAKPKAPRAGEVPDGAMIVKEMFLPPAEIYTELQQLLAQNEAAKCKDETVYEELLSRLVSSWTVMVKSSQGSHDGWFWAGPGAPKMVDGKLQTIEDAIESQLDDDTSIADSGFGLTCIRCHASAAEELTFSALRNITGFLPDENLLTFRSDNSWRNADYFKNFPLSILASNPECLKDSIFKLNYELPAPLRPFTETLDPRIEEFLRFHMPQTGVNPGLTAGSRLPAINPAFAETFPQIKGVNSNQVKGFPSQFADHVVAGKKIEQFITSDNCNGCHGGLAGSPYDLAMFLQTGPNYGDGYNVSEYGEWRWSPMGLAGRDPIFYSQLETEMVLLERDAKKGGLLKGSLKDNQDQVTNTCLSCHGSMGQRQLTIDARTDKTLDPVFKVDYVYLSQLLSAKTPEPENYRYHKYGELAREGISCLTCHHMTAPDPKSIANWRPDIPGWITRSTPKELAYFLFHNSTGRAEMGPSNEIYGPLEGVAVKPMEHSMGITPKYNAFIKQSQICGTCHTINLPNIGLSEDEFPVLTAAETNPALKPYAHSIEQATFLEWQNSKFANSKNGEPAEGFKSCQGCHMPGGFETLDGSIKIDQLTTKIATIQDVTYPEVDHRLPDKDITISPRTDYKRHEHVGLNIFLLEMFNQFPEILGVSKQDYMTSAKNGNGLAIENMARQARDETVDIGLSVQPLQGNKMTVDVSVHNKTGHRFPSGVAFRRAFLELLVMNANGDVLWSSGRTNSVGVIVGGNGRPLQTEFLPDKNSFQPHYQVIDRQDQVQIYEELTQNVDFDFTTSFIHRVHHVKDNRLLPMGWRAAEFFKNQGQVMFQFMKATDPDVEGDPDYEDQGPDFSGTDHLQYLVSLPAGMDLSGLSVKATMFYQSIPPYYLNQRFSIAPDGPATQRLYYLTSHLNVAGTHIEGWKLPLSSAALVYDSRKKQWSQKRSEM